MFRFIICSKNEIELVFSTGELKNQVSPDNDNELYNTLYSFSYCYHNYIIIRRMVTVTQFRSLKPSLINNHLYDIANAVFQLASLLRRREVMNHVSDVCILNYNN